jgi:mycothiol synthase
MIEIRRAETDADLEAWRQVRIAVLPHERAESVQWMRETETPERLLLVAAVDGDVVGSGIGDRSSLGGRVFVAPRVVPEARRRGVGSALLRALAAHARSLGADKLVAFPEADDAAIAFATRYGFEEVDRQVEQVKTLRDEPDPVFPGRVEVATIAERPELLREAYDLGAQGYADMATDVPAAITLDEWMRDEATIPAASFVALVDGEVVGYSGLMRDADDPTRAEDGLTVVRRDWRRRGLATALKRAELAAAAALGIREVYTWTQTGNEGMRAVNDRLRYEYRHVALTMTASLETVERGLA